MSLVEKLKENAEDIFFLGITLSAAAGFGLYDGLVEQKGLEHGHGRSCALGIATVYGLLGILAGVAFGFENNTRIKDIIHGEKIFYPMKKKKTVKDILKYSSAAGTAMFAIPAFFYLAGRGIGYAIKNV